MTVRKKPPHHAKVVSTHSGDHVKASHKAGHHHKKAAHGHHARRRRKA